MKWRTRKIVILLCFIVCILVIILLKGVFTQDTESSTKELDMTITTNNTNLSQIKQLKMFDDSNGWALNNQNEILYTTTGKDNFQSVKKVESISSNSDAFVNAYFMSDTTAYITYFLDDNENISVEYTKDAGKEWNVTKVPYLEYGGSNSVYINMVDEKCGYLLYCSDPGAGLMKKILYQTLDGGNTFAFYTDLSDVITGYPTGISYLESGQGYISTTYHGEENYLYVSTDNSKTWESVKLPAPDGIGKWSYIDGYPPVFYDENSGKLILKYVGEDVQYIMYSSEDSGATWKVDGSVSLKGISSYSCETDSSGYIIDNEGTVYYYH